MRWKQTNTSVRCDRACSSTLGASPHGQYLDYMCQTQQAALHHWHGVSGQLPTCDNYYWFPCVKELVNETILGLPLPMRLEHLLFQGGVQISKREGGARTGDVPVLPPGLPVAAVTDHLAQQQQRGIKLSQTLCAVLQCEWP